jgi:hypothetical protein
VLIEVIVAIAVRAIAKHHEQIVEHVEVLQPLDLARLKLRFGLPWHRRHW